MVILIDLGKVFNKTKHPASTNLTQDTDKTLCVFNNKMLKGFLFPLRNQEHQDTHF